MAPGYPTYKLGTQHIYLTLFFGEAIMDLTRPTTRDFVLVLDPYYYVLFPVNDVHSLASQRKLSNRWEIWGCCGGLLAFIHPISLVVIMEHVRDGDNHLMSEA